MGPDVPEKTRIRYYLLRKKEEYYLEVTNTVE